MPLGTEVGLGLRDIVLDGDSDPPPLEGDSDPPPLEGHSPPLQFSANVRCGQTAGWTKMLCLVGMEVGLGPGDFVFDGDPATPEKKAHRPTQFLDHVYCGQTAGWMKTPLGTEVGLDLGPGHIVLDGVLPLRENGTAAPPLFRPMSII